MDYLTSKIYRIGILSFIFLFLNSCQTSGPVSPQEKEFSFRVFVKDQAGNPVPGIRVSAWNLIKTSNDLIIGKKSLINPQTASTYIEISLEENSNVTLNIYDLDNNFVSNIADSFLVKGKYGFVWTINETSPLKIYKCRLTAMDSISDRILFSDSMYMTLFQPDWDFTYIGFTDYQGNYETTDQHLFPSTLDDFIPLNYAVWDPFINDYDTSGTFRFIDSVRIVLTDTSAHVQNVFTDHISSGTNLYEYTWNKEGSSFNEKKYRADFNKEISRSGNNNLTDYFWKLYQNYPNPFN